MTEAMEQVRRDVAFRELDEQIPGAAIYLAGGWVGGWMGGWEQADFISSTANLPIAFQQ
jgi:hypothetical protein